MSICASCTSFSINSPILSSSNNKPSWLQDHDYVEDFITSVNTFSPKHQTKYDQIVDISLGKKYANKTILYWGAKSCNDLIIHDAKYAYGTFKNNGIVKLDTNGNGRLFLQCPQIYKTKEKGSSKDKSFYRHFHYIIANKECTLWLPQLYTHLIVCKRNIRYVLSKLRDTSAVLLNALPAEYYAKDHIPNSYNLHYKSAKKMSANELQKWLLEVIQLHYPTIHNAIRSKKLAIQDVPIICYCAHESCNASELLETELIKKGMHRVDSFPGGMREWSKQ